MTSITITTPLRSVKPFRPPQSPAVFQILSADLIEDIQAAATREGGLCRKMADGLLPLLGCGYKILVLSPTNDTDINSRSKRSHQLVFIEVLDRKLTIVLHKDICVRSPITRKKCKNNQNFIGILVTRARQSRDDFHRKLANKILIPCQFIVAGHVKTVSNGDYELLFALKGPGKNISVASAPASLPASTVRSRQVSTVIQVRAQKPKRALRYIMDLESAGDSVKVFSAPAAASDVRALSASAGAGVHDIAISASIATKIHEAVTFVSAAREAPEPDAAPSAAAGSPDAKTASVSAAATTPAGVISLSVPAALSVREALAPAIPAPAIPEASASRAATVSAAWQARSAASAQGAGADTAASSSLVIKITHPDTLAAPISDESKVKKRDVDPSMLDTRFYYHRNSPRKPSKKIITKAPDDTTTKVVLHSPEINGCCTIL